MKSETTEHRPTNTEPTDAVTGAFGFSGRWIARALQARGRRVRTLTNHPAPPDGRGAIDARPLPLDDPTALRTHLQGVDTLYNTYWVRFERGATTYANAVANTRRLFAAAREAGVRRVVHVSIANARAGAPLPYYTGKAELEAALAESGLSYAIVRPTVLFGDEGILLHNIAWLLRHLPVFGVVADGSYRLQPVHVRDLAELAVDLGLGDENVAVDAAGPEIFTYRDLVLRLRAAVGSSTRLVPVPAGLALAVARGLGAWLGDVLITRDELVGLRRELLVSHEAPRCPTRLGDWIQRHAADLGARYRSELALHFAAPKEANA